jgi:hypothetical protein
MSRLCDGHSADRQDPTLTRELHKNGAPAPTPVELLFAKLSTYADPTDVEMVAARARFLVAVKRRLLDEEGA